MAENVAVFFPLEFLKGCQEQCKAEKLKPEVFTSALCARKLKAILN